MNTYFKEVKTLEELKKEYFRLIKINHPDKGGDTATMQQINNEYDELRKTLKNTRTQEADTNETILNDIFKEVINKIIHLDIEIEICGSWIWLSGSTYDYKNEIKEAGFYWASKKKMWYWHSPEQQTSRHKPQNMDNIRNKYGSTKIETKKINCLA